MSKTSEFVLYHYWRSSCSWRVRWAMNLKKLEYQDRIVNLLQGEQRSPEFLKVNPQGFVPVLQVGNEMLAESLAILEWLEEKFPAPSLLPQSSIDRARVRQFCLGIVAGTQPLQNLEVIRSARAEEKEQQAFARKFIESGLHKLENLVRHWKCNGTYVFGGSLTFADLCLVPQVYNAHRFQCDITKFPTLDAITSRCLETEECRKAHPDNQPGK